MQFFFDDVSPYSYLAWTQIHALAARHQREVEAVPTLFAALVDAHGTRGPAEVPAKRRYVFSDAVRTARRLGVPFGPPPAHPFNPLLALRVSSLPIDTVRRRALVDGLFAATWAGGAGVTDPAGVARIAVQAGLDGDAMVAEAGTDAAKARVRRQTDAAIAAGVFGVPSVIVDGELFWGHDAFPNLELFLSGGGAIDSALAATWAELRSEAMRKSRAP